MRNRGLPLYGQSGVQPKYPCHPFPPRRLIPMDVDRLGRPASYEPAYGVFDVTVTSGPPWLRYSVVVEDEDVPALRPEDV